MRWIRSFRRPAVAATVAMAVPLSVLGRKAATMVTTTHDPRGGGQPRLIFGFDDTVVPGSAPRVFSLPRGVTTIGSGVGNDLRLAGLDGRHAEIRRDAADEYVYVHLGRSSGSKVDGRAMGEKALRTGDRIEIGTWTLSFYRDEFADHGRPYGGRLGGERFTDQRTQKEPRGRGTSAEGGSDRSDVDPGEYF